MIDSKINNFQGFLFERNGELQLNEEEKKIEINIEKGSKEESVLLYIGECISNSIICLNSISYLSITDADVIKEINTIKGNKETITGEIKNKNIKDNNDFISKIEEIQTAIKNLGKKLADSKMSEDDFKEIEEKSKENKSGEKLEGALYYTLKDTFGLYQDAIKNYMNALTGYLKIYKKKTRYTESTTK